MRRLIFSLMISLILVVSLCGCGSIFNREYVVVNDYVSAQTNASGESERVSVKNFTELRSAILQLIYEGTSSGSIEFDSDYAGDATEDLASACWQIRTQNALCAYCVDNIAYELSQIVTYYEATIYVTYSERAVSPENITHLNYSSELTEVIKSEMNLSETHFAVLVSSGVFDSAKIEMTCQEQYRANPLCSYGEPKVSVNIYSGSGLQKLYDIVVNYGVTADELASAQKRVYSIPVLSEISSQTMSDGEKAVAICDYMMEHCSLAAEDASESSAFAALLSGTGNSEGMALGFQALCDEAGLISEVVYGQKNWQSHCWNIITLDGERYHVDVSACISDGIEAGFLFSDSAFWGVYRWNMSDYDACSGSLTYSEIVKN